MMEIVTMVKVRFSDLDPVGKRAVFWLANQANTLTALITESALHPGEILEAAAFMNEHPKGSTPHTILAERLKLGIRSDESILACIQRADPTYRSMTVRADSEIDELLTELKYMSGCR